MDTPGAELKSGPSLVLRLVRGAALWALPILAFTAFALTWFYRSSTYRLFDEPLNNTITSLIASVEIGADPMGESQENITLSREPIDPRYQQALSGYYWMVGTLAPNGAVTPLRASRSMAEETLNLPAADARIILDRPGTFVQSRADGPDQNDPLRVVAKSVVFQKMADRPLVMIAAADGRPAAMAVRNFAALAIGFMILLTLGLIIGILTQVRLGLRPLFELRDRVVDVREGRATRVDGDYPQEIQPLANELNSLIDHNKNVVEQAKTHVGNLAHALKTPLAVLINEAGGSKSKLADIVTRQSEAMKNQVDHHLRRARAAARGQAIGVSASVNDTLEPLARTLERIYRSKDIAFDLRIEDGLMFRGEKRDLEEMAGNLMDNACKWTVSDVVVIAKPSPQDEAMLDIRVIDNGPGLPPEKYGEALKRGARLDEATPGTGFGLAIVDDLAKAYKGGVMLGAGQNGGLDVTLTLPRRV